MTDWNDNQPIFRQLSDQISQQILQGIWREGAALPSIRTVATDLKINHLTVMKSYQLLVDEGLVEKKRGQGMFVALGAIEQLKTSKRAQFIQQQVPQIADTLRHIDMDVEEFIKQLKLQMKGQ
ncbi:GntR family transcriptional regulator [Vibrio sp. T187]|uniref:GntR family transcriptional regulator n=1 Tax=Vibrio TaxID=662 RepID=UPI0010C94F12|nr:MULTISPECIES: GntR family transcriptional regulator [Vibrio]MBW3695846.1 GntR family transcriptional regulator [Vibrio sp. T187]